MTMHERANPDCLNDSRIERIAKGSGQPKGQVLGLIGRFKTMRSLMRNLGKGKKKALARLGLGDMADMVSDAVPQQKRMLVDLKKRKDKRKLAKKARKRRR
jgi:signal recognition particle subunit SRP54